ncbi:MAG: MarR family winged helix-turn-helix transcriptional regulator [Thermomicrobiales bacterium]
MTETMSVSASVPFGRQLGETARAARGLLKVVLASDATTFERWVALNTLATRGQAMRSDLLHRELADGLETDPSVISKLLAELAADGLIQATTAPGELQVTRIALTEQGAALHGSLRESVARTTNQIVGNLDPDDLRTTLRVLAQVNEQVTTLRAG